MGLVLKALLTRRMATVSLLGFSSGIPLALTGATLQAWMKTENIDLTLIGLFSLVGLPYGWKFLWSPLMDRFAPPFLGRRRGWTLICQVALVITIAAMGFSNPVQFPMLTAAIAVAVAFFSASQDIVIDAYRVDVMTNKDEMGLGAALYIAGYRIAMIVSGSIALILADHFSWKMVYLIMATSMSIGILASLFGPEPLQPPKTPKSLHEAVILPFVEFFKKKGAFEVLTFITLYKLDVIVATALMTPFILDIGFTKTEIGVVAKNAGLIATIAGTLAGGTLMVKWGLNRSLWIFGFAQGFAGLTFMILAQVGHHWPTMVTAVIVENFCSGMGTAAYSAFMMRICDKRFTATQYALLTSFMAQARVIGSAPTGWLAKTVGWETYFLISILIAIPGLLVLTRYKKWEQLK